jgi:hypothetical protein
MTLIVVKYFFRSQEEKYDRVVYVSDPPYAMCVKEHYLYCARGVGFCERAQFLIADVANGHCKT